jgi:hypothetical protein
MREKAVTPPESELEAIRAEIRDRFPPETIIEELRSGGKPRDVILGAAALLATEITPALLEAVEYAAKGTELDERESALAFYGLHILGAARDVRVFPALMRILRLPTIPLANFLGDALTETISRVTIGAYNGAAEALYALIADTEADEFSRLEMLGVIAFLAFEGRIEIAEVKAFLVRFDDERLAPEQDMAWCGWETAIALLGFADLVPRVQAARHDGRTPEGYQDLKHVFADLKRAETDWKSAERFKKEHHLGYIEDIAEELSWVPDSDKDEEYSGDFEGGSTALGLGQSYINPLRHVGRNDPCPCGSGKKAKRCCLAG